MKGVRGRVVVWGERICRVSSEERRNGREWWCGWGQSGGGMQYLLQKDVGGFVKCVVVKEEVIFLVFRITCMVVSSSLLHEY